ncbi:glycosyltransferase family 2 protein [Limnovirga soli]|uniref:Glycosyltransferase n=1 Tax=Limnovirga soli TaxID=2656915 RepID=A0A8J8JVK0_9BACT|nr:glycosyltransferase [Limnovirga soli]NNV54321.1 glycosyltransferase [Limnovirga soli]
MPLISICIPAYKRVDYLKRLLDSITMQTFRDFEVVVTDDSPDDSVEQLLLTYSAILPIVYFKNQPAKGTPANWNVGISKAKGEWIKLIHDDDWFAEENSLQVFVNHIATGKHFIFSAYANRVNEKSHAQVMHLQHSWKKRIIKEPMTLLAYNVVGPPSVTLLHRSITEQYDERMKWRVDMDFYVRLLLQEKNFCYIDKVLVNVGISETQVTNYCFQNPAVELPEGYLLLEKYGSQRLKNIWVYDAWWRLLRNMHIRQTAQLTSEVDKPWPTVIIKMVADLNSMPDFVLKTGVLSKLAMGISYIRFILG